MQSRFSHSRYPAAPSQPLDRLQSRASRCDASALRAKASWVREPPDDAEHDRCCDEGDQGHREHQPRNALLCCSYFSVIHPMSVQPLRTWHLRDLTVNNRPAGALLAR